MIKCLHTDDLYCLQHYDEIICENKETCRAVYAHGKRDAVKHGEWDCIDFLNRCNACNAIIDTRCSETDWNYCPNCGAKMNEPVTDCHKPNEVSE